MSIEEVSSNNDSNIPIEYQNLLAKMNLYQLEEEFKALKRLKETYGLNSRVDQLKFYYARQLLFERKSSSIVNNTTGVISTTLH